MIERSDSAMHIAKQCDALRISRSAAYYKRKCTVQERDVLILEHIRSVLARLPFYGYRKVSRMICAHHITVSEKRVRCIMKRAGLQAIVPECNLSKVRHEHKKYPYLLAGKLIRYPNQVWATDITYIKLSSGHMYLMAIINVYSLKVLNRILTSECWTQVLREYRIEISIDGKNRVLDNIYVKQLWHSLKYEDIYIKQYESVRELRQGIDNYFRFYNTDRFHQSLDYKTPDEMYQSFQVVDVVNQTA